MGGAEAGHVCWRSFQIANAVLGSRHGNGHGRDIERRAVTTHITLHLHYSTLEMSGMFDKKKMIQAHLIG